MPPATRSLLILTRGNFSIQCRVGCLDSKAKCFQEKFEYLKTEVKADFKINLARVEKEATPCIPWCTLVPNFIFYVI